MQFHDHGYVSTDPRVQPAAPSAADRPASLPDVMDVLVVGAGPAGVVTAASLSQFPDVHTRLIDRRPERLQIGQADGIQARSVETFQAFGFAGRITDEAYRISSMCFWTPDPNNPERIVRSSRAEDDPHGISEFPHLIVNQARVLDYFIEYMANSPSRMKPDFGWEYVGHTRDDSQEYPLEITLRRTASDDAQFAEGAERTVRAKAIVGSDGARSKVRDTMGRKAIGGQAFHAWAVMDVLAETDFPDIRTKCAIQSKAGSILHIPREGNYLFRMYVDLGEVPEDGNREIRKTSVETAIAKANEIIAPYTLEVRDVAWYSVYEVGHRVTDAFDDRTEAGVDASDATGVSTDGAPGRMPRAFITGDACHTHSAKAGQGMNVSMQDGFNLGWKLGYVLTGRATPELLATYSDERQVIAQNLIDFDREWSTLMAKPAHEFSSPSELSDFYTSTAEFPAGFMTQYPENSHLIGSAQHQELATGYPLGKRFKSAMVSRVCDTNPVHLGHHHRADGRYRIYVFADQTKPGDAGAVSQLAEWLEFDPASPVVKYTRENDDLQSVFDVKVVYQQPYDEVDFTDVPTIFKPHGGPLNLLDYEHVYAALPQDDIFDARGVSRDGAIVVVRPDMYVSAILPLTDTDGLAAHFDGILSASGEPQM